MNSVINPLIIRSSQWSTAHAILSFDASSLRTNSGVHTIGLSSLHLPWLSTIFMVHSYNSWGNNAKKFHGFSYISRTLIIVRLILADSCFPASRTRESFYPATLQFLSLPDYSDMKSDMSYADPGSGKGTIYWLVVAWPRFKGDLAEQFPVRMALSATVCGVRTEVSLEVVWEGPRTRFPHPGDI